VSAEWGMDGKFGDAVGYVYANVGFVQRADTGTGAGLLRESCKWSEKVLGGAAIDALVCPMIKLLSTDFDGTVVDHFGEPKVSPDFLEALVQLRDRGVLWAVNTGRELAHIVDGLAEFKLPLVPDFVLTAEREVFHRGVDGCWQDFGDWNRRCQEAHQRLYADARVLLQDIEEYLRNHVQAHPIFEGDHLIGLATETDAEMDRVCEFLDRERTRVAGFQYMRNSVYVRFCHEDYSKGTALGELARLTGVPADAIFAAGDHYNDLPMLDGRHARWVACPSNAVEVVKDAVRRAGGFVASSPASQGLFEAFKAFGMLEGGSRGRVA
jgi:HAD superfamily hydrolase (TIGR01484 family)